MNSLDSPGSSLTICGDLGQGGRGEADMILAGGVDILVNYLMICMRGLINTSNKLCFTMLVDMIVPNTLRFAITVFTNI